MKRSSNITCCLLLFTVAIAHPIPARADAPRPNVLIVLLDDLGYSDLGCYGGEIETPSLDALADGGLRFEAFYNSARCCPSRAALVTGLYPPLAGVADFVSLRANANGPGPAYLGRLNDRCVTLAEVLRPAGYGCYYVGKWHLHRETNPVVRGFDESYGYNMNHSDSQWDPGRYVRLPEGRRKEFDPPAGEFYATDVFNQYALEFIKQGQQTGKPWLVMLGHSSPHFPLHAPADSVEKYVARYRRGWDALREERFARMKSLGLVDGPRWKLTERSLVPVDQPAIANGYAGRPNPAWSSLDADRREDLARRMAIFAAMVEHVDRGIGQIVAHLRATDSLDNTLILVTSDNGGCYEWGPLGFDEHSRKGVTRLHKGEALATMGGPGTYHSVGSGWSNLSNTPLRKYKHFTHEGGVAAPCVVHWPAGVAKPGRWVRDRSHLIDILPTLRDLAGADYPLTHNGQPIHAEEGQTLRRVFAGESLPVRPLYFAHQGARAVIDGDWKLVWSKREPAPIEWELYNLAQDRCETSDLAKQHPERVKKMTAQWFDYVKRTGLKEGQGRLGGECVRRLQEVVEIR
jgi:arylsulfatase